MNKFLGMAAFGLGLGVVAWIGAGYVGSNLLALGMTAAIAAFYLMGARELLQFHRDTAGLDRALAAVPAQADGLAPWLATVPAALQNAVRGRIEGERTGLPGPVMAPFLVGLLVLLGMLGTFLGMVVTLDGAGRALQGSTDLASLRAALGVPVKGLGLAFGTSVAGVAASAMLGLMAAASRRERLRSAQALDSHIAGRLRAFSPAHQREQMFLALQQQVRVLPEAMAQMQASLHATLETMAGRMDRQAQLQAERLLASQDAHFRHARSLHEELAAAVGASLKDSLAEAARAAGQSVQSVTASAMGALSREGAALHERFAATAAQGLDDLASRLADAARIQQQQALESLERHAQAVHSGAAVQAERTMAEVKRLADAVQDGAAAQARQAIAEMARVAGGVQAGAAGQARQTIAEVERLAAAVQAGAAAQAQHAISEMERLARTAGDAPRAAVEAMARLRQQLSDSLARDNAVLEERERLMQTVQVLLDGIRHAATEQRSAIDALVSSSSSLLQQVGVQLSERMEAGSGRLESVAAQVTASAIEVSSLGEAFGVGVQQFCTSNQALAGALERVEAALARSAERSDEQLAYCVAQAREVIQLSMLSQRQIVEDLQQIAGRPMALASEAG